MLAIKFRIMITPLNKRISLTKVAITKCEICSTCNRRRINQRVIRWWRLGLIRDRGLSHWNLDRPMQIML